MRRIPTVYISDTLFIYPQLMESTMTGQLSISTNWRYTGGESYRYDIIDQAALRITMPDVPDWTLSGLSGHP